MPARRQGRFIDARTAGALRADSQRAGLLDEALGQVHLHPDRHPPIPFRNTIPASEKVHVDQLPLGFNTPAPSPEESHQDR
jgi:hypothetical protein